MLEARLLSILRCPVSKLPLKIDGCRLVSQDGRHRYEVFDGIPLLTVPEMPSTDSWFHGVLEDNERAKTAVLDADFFIRDYMVATCGNLFRGAKLTGNYPIPDFPSELTPGLTLDVGSNWGRWAIAGAKAGHSMIGVDIHLESLLAARTLSRRLIPGNLPLWVLGDARRLPFASSSFDNAVSYSVVQHFSREDLGQTLAEVGRILKSGGNTMFQMANAGGLKTRLIKRQHRFSDGQGIDVRYYTIDELLRLFGQNIGPSDWSVDCYLGLNVHAKDLPLISYLRKPVVYAAEALKFLGTVARPFERLADSVWIRARKATCQD